MVGIVFPMCHTLGTLPLALGLRSGVWVYAGDVRSPLMLVRATRKSHFLKWPIRVPRIALPIHAAQSRAGHSLAWPLHAMQRWCFHPKADCFQSAIGWVIQLLALQSQTLPRLANPCCAPPVPAFPLLARPCHTESFFSEA